MSRRAEIQMTPDEIQRLLAETQTITLATIGSDGMPQLTAMWFALADQEIHMWTYAKAQKVVNLRRDPRMVVLAEAGDTYDTLRGAELRGTAEIIEDHDRVVAIGRALGRRNGMFTDEPALDAWAIATAKKRVGLRLHVDHAATWDHRKL